MVELEPTRLRIRMLRPRFDCFSRSAPDPCSRAQLGPDGLDPVRVASGELSELASRARAIDAGEADCEHWSSVRARILGPGTLDLLLAPAAAFEVADAVAAYDATRPGLGRAVLDAVERTFWRLRFDSDTATELVAGLRRTAVSGFPYDVVHRATHEGAQVIAMQPLRNHRPKRRSV